MLRHRFITYCLFAAPFLASCAGMVWTERKDWPGVLVEGNRRPNMVQSCDTVSLAIADTKYCQVAFVDHQGRKLDTYELRNLIKDYRANIPEIKTYEGATRYQYYLLTIAPVVVMVVPKIKGSYSSSCRRHNLREGCLDDNLFSLNFRDSPPVMANSFWFSPDRNIPGRPIEADAQAITIPLGSSKLELTSDGQQWSIRRDEVK